VSTARGVPQPDLFLVEDSDAQYEAFRLPLHGQTSASRRHRASISHPSSLMSFDPPCRGLYVVLTLDCTPLRPQCEFDVEARYSTVLDARSGNDGAFRANDAARIQLA
jgi:hypothetical protein